MLTWQNKPGLSVCKMSAHLSLSEHSGWAVFSWFRARSWSLLCPPAQQDGIRGADIWALCAWEWGPHTESRGYPEPVTSCAPERVSPIQSGLGPRRVFTSTLSATVRAPAFVCCGLNQGQQLPEVRAGYCTVYPWAASRGCSSMAHLSAARAACPGADADEPVKSRPSSFRQHAAGSLIIFNFRLQRGQVPPAGFELRLASPTR